MPDGEMARRPPTQEDQLRRLARGEDPLDDWQRFLTGQSARIHIPLKDSVQIRDVARVLRVLSSAMELLANAKDRSEYHILRDCRSRIKEADALINKRRPR
jgi:hypothetical protein